MESVLETATDFEHETPLTKGRISSFFLLLVILFCLWPELRLSPSGLQFSFKQSAGSMQAVEGYPRLTELAIIAFFCTSLWYTLLNLGKIGLYKYIAALSFFVISIRVFHYSQFDILRSGFISPMMLLCGCISLPMNKRRADNIYFFIIVSVLISSLIMLMQVAKVLDLPKLDIYDARHILIGHRYLGLGQSYAYQSAYILMGISVAWAFILGKRPRWQLLITYFTLAMSYIALVVTGTRTGYFAGALLLIYVLFRLGVSRAVLGIAIVALLMSGIFLATGSGNNNLLHGTQRALSSRLDLTEDRYGAWIAGLRVAAASPIIGVDNFPDAASSQGIHLRAHEQNGFIALVNFGGVLTLVTYCLLIFEILRKTRMKNDGKGQESAVIKYSVRFALLSYTIYMMSEIIYSSIQVQVIFVLVLGIALNRVEGSKFNHSAGTESST